MINWEKWEDEKLKADSRNKLLFLRRFGEKESDFMEKGVFGRKGIETLSNSYMPVKVDADERPDIFRRYGLKHTPTVMLLTKDGRTLGGGNLADYETFIKFIIEVGTLLNRERDIIEKYGAEEIEDDEEVDIELKDEVKIGDMVNSLAEKFVETPILSAEILLTLFEYFLRKKDERRCRRIIEHLEKIEDKVESGIFSGQLVSNPMKFSTRKTVLENIKYAVLLSEFSKEFGDKNIEEKAKRQSEFLSTFKNNGFFSKSIAEDDEYYKSTKGIREIREKPEKDKRVFADTCFDTAFYLAKLGRHEEAKSVINYVLQNLWSPEEKKIFHSGEKDVANLMCDLSSGLRAMVAVDKETFKKEIQSFLDIAKTKKGEFLYFDFDENGFGFLKKKKIDVEANIKLSMFYILVGEKDEARNILIHLIPFLGDEPTLMIKWYLTASEILK